MRFNGEAPPSGHSVPGWMEAAFDADTPAQRPAADTAQLERAAYERGRHDAEQAALEIADKKIEETMKRYADALLEIGKYKQVLYAQAEREVVRLALEVAKKIVHREVRVDHEIIQTLVRVALGRVAAKSAATVHVNPADYNFLLEQHGAARSGSGERGMVLMADNSVDRGGCLIETECGDIDARIGEEFREVERAFFGAEDQEP